MCIRRKAHKITKKQLRIIEIFNKIKGAYHQNLNHSSDFRDQKISIRVGLTRDKSYQQEAQVMLIFEEITFTCFIIGAQHFMVNTFETTQLGHQGMMVGEIIMWSVTP